MAEVQGASELLGGATSRPAGPRDFTHFFRDEYARLLRSVYVVVQSHEVAEDIAQDAFLVTWNHWSRVSTYDRPELWLRRVAVRLAIRAAKRARVVTPIVTDLPVEQKQTDLDLLAGIVQLPPAQRAAVALFYLEDRSVAELADIMSCAPATAKVHLHRARKRLAIVLGEEES